jgi:hypothetical protein
MQTGWPCGGLSQNCPATLCAVSLAPSPAFRPTEASGLFCKAPSGLGNSPQASAPRAFGPRGLCPISPMVYHRAESDAPDEIGTPPPSGRFDKSPLSEYTLSAPFQVTIQASSPHPRRLRRQRRSRWGRGEAKQLPFQNKNALGGDHSTDQRARLHAGQSGAEVAHSIPQKAAPVKSRRGRFFVPCVLPERSTDGFQFRGPGVPPEFLRPPATPPARLLPSSHHPSPVFPGGGPPDAPDS